jgi:hypothetical protein
MGLQYLAEPTQISLIANLPETTISLLFPAPRQFFQKE